MFEQFKNIFNNQAYKMAFCDRMMLRDPNDPYSIIGNTQRMERFSLSMQTNKMGLVEKQQNIIFRDNQLSHIYVKIWTIFGIPERYC